MQIRFSVVITTYNEEASIKPLLDSLAEQTLRPLEIIVADAGSNDKTIGLIKKWKMENRIKVVLLECGRVNRSVGRNLGTKSATSDYIAVTDAGCVADKSWLFKLDEGFGGDVEVVAGFYKTKSTKALQRIFSFYTGVMNEDLDEHSFLPSSRSIAFKKSVWQKIGGYPEDLDTCEDLVFAKRLKDNFKMKVQKDALVYWEQAEDLFGFINQIKGYARGDVQAFYWPHVVKIILVYLRYILFIVFWPLFILYLLYPIAKFIKKVREIEEIMLLPIVQVTADIGVMWGALTGINIGDKN